MASVNTTGLIDYTNTTTQAAAFFDPGWLLVAKIQLYVNYAMIGIGIAGTIANALILYALIVHRAQQSKKKGVHLLIINQNLIDLCSCLSVVVSVSTRLSNMYLTGALGYILCSVFISENLSICLIHSSIINLMTITIERYLKAVYPFWSKKKLKRWMIHIAIAFSWIGGIVSTGPVGLVTSFIEKGACLPFELYYRYDGIKMGYGIWNFFSFFVLPLITFVYCYGHIAAVMRRQMRVMAGHNAQSASQAQSNRIKWNIIKTMIIVSAFFVACYCPVVVYILTVDSPGMLTKERLIGFILTLILPYVNMSLNPFIYATKHDGVRRILARMIICRKRNDVASVGGTFGLFTTSTKKPTRIHVQSV